METLSAVWLHWPQHKEWHGRPQCVLWKNLFKWEHEARETTWPSSQRSPCAWGYNFGGNLKTGTCSQSSAVGIYRTFYCHECQCSLLILWSCISHSDAEEAHTPSEELSMPGAKILVPNMFGESETKKLSRVSVSNNTIRRQIDDMVEDVEMQVVAKIRSSTHKISIQMYESSDVSSRAQLICFACYIVDDKLQDEYVFCLPLEKITKSQDIIYTVSTYFTKHGIHWEEVGAVCTDGYRQCSE